MCQSSIVDAKAGLYKGLSCSHIVFHCRRLTLLGATPPMQMNCRISKFSWSFSTFYTAFLLICKTEGWLKEEETLVMFGFMCLRGGASLSCFSIRAPRPSFARLEFACCHTLTGRYAQSAAWVNILPFFRGHAHTALHPDLYPAQQQFFLSGLSFGLHGMLIALSNGSILAPPFPLGLSSSLLSNSLEMTLSASPLGFVIFKFFIVVPVFFVNCTDPTPKRDTTACSVVPFKVATAFPCTVMVEADGNYTCDKQEHCIYTLSHLLELHHLHTFSPWHFEDQRPIFAGWQSWETHDYTLWVHWQQQVSHCHILWVQCHFPLPFGQKVTSNEWLTAASLLP